MRSITHFACQATIAEADKNSITYVVSTTPWDLINNKIVKPAEKTNQPGESHSGLNNRQSSEGAVSQRN